MKKFTIQAFPWGNREKSRKCKTAKLLSQPRYKPDKYNSEVIRNA